MSVLFLLIFLCFASNALSDAPIDSNSALDAANVTSIFQVEGISVAGRADPAIVAELMPEAGVGAGAASWPTSRILKEVGKQAIDQPGHFLIGGAPIWASRCLLGVPWFGWAAAPILAYREWLQWPSNRWWDPPLDWAFFTLGAVWATWNRRPGQRLAGGLAAVRQSVAWTLALRGRMPHAG